MSLSLLDQYIASIAPGEVSLVSVRRGFKAKLLTKLHATCAPTSTNQKWESELALLENLLVQSQRRLPLTVVLSNHLVRYKVLPATPPLMPSAEVTNVAQQCFKEVYGDVVDDWTIRVDALPAGDSVIASAIDTTLFAALLKMAEKLSIKLKSVQPYLMTVFNVNHRQFTALPSCFVQVEADRILIALMKNGAWQSIAGAAAPANWVENLPSLIARQTLLADWKDEVIHILLSEPGLGAPITIPENTHWKINRAFHPICSGYSPSNDKSFAMALSAL